MSEAKEMSQCKALAVILKSGSATNYVVNMVCEKLEENDKLKSRVAELEGALEAIIINQKIMAGDSSLMLDKLTCYQIANNALNPISTT